MNLVNSICLMANAAKMKVTNFMQKEKGGAEIIAIVLVIAVVLVLGGVFWTEISKFFGGLINSMTGKNPMGSIDPNNVP